MAEPVSNAEPLWQEGVQFLPPVLYPAPGFQAPAQSLGEQQPPKVDCEASEWVTVGSRWWSDNGNNTYLFRIIIICAWSKSCLLSASL